MTAYTKEALDPFRSGTAWCVEGHDEWPEERTFRDLRDMKFQDLPDNVSRLTVNELMTYQI